MAKQEEAIKNTYGLSTDAFGLVSFLLEKDSSKRVGNSSEDVEKLKKHKFFESVNWAEIQQILGSPVFQPSAKDMEGYRYFTDCSDLGLDAEQMVADDYDFSLNESSETPVLLKEFSFF